MKEKPVNEITRMIDGKLCLSSVAMVEVFSVHHQTLGNWAQHGCPKIRRGWWALVDVINWRNGTGPDGEQPLSGLKTKYDAEVKRLTAEKLELANAIARGEFVSREEIIGELSRYFVELRKSLTGLASKLAVDIAPFVEPTTARRLEREMAELIDAALERMSAGEVYEAPKRRILTG